MQSEQIDEIKYTDLYGTCEKSSPWVAVFVEVSTRSSYGWLIHFYKIQGIVDVYKEKAWVMTWPAMYVWTGGTFRQGRHYRPSITVQITPAGHSHPANLGRRP